MKEDTLKELLMRASSSASSMGFISGTSNWVAHVARVILRAEEPEITTTTAAAQPPSNDSLVEVLDSLIENVRLLGGMEYQRKVGPFSTAETIMERRLLTACSEKTRVLTLALKGVTQ